MSWLLVGRTRLGMSAHQLSVKRHARTYAQSQKYYSFAIFTRVDHDFACMTSTVVLLEILVCD